MSIIIWLVGVWRCLCTDKKLKQFPRFFFCQNPSGELRALFIQMVNKFIAIIALCCCFLSASAQHTDKLDKIRLGVKGGVNISNMHYSNLGEHDAGGITSGVGGIFAEFDLGSARKFSIRPELLFLSRGSEVDGIDVYGDKFNYLSFASKV